MSSHIESFHRGQISNRPRHRLVGHSDEPVNDLVQSVRLHALQRQQSDQEWILQQSLQLQTYISCSIFVNICRHFFKGKLGRIGIELLILLGSEYGREKVSSDSAEHEVRVRHGQLSPFPVADGAGVRTHTLRPDHKQSVPIEQPTSPSRGHCVDVQLRTLDRHARRICLEDVLESPGISTDISRRSTLSTDTIYQLITAGTHEHIYAVLPYRTRSQASRLPSLPQEC